MVLNARKYAPNYELIYGFGVPHYWDRCRDMEMAVWKISAQRSEEHPCPFPVEIPKRLIESSCPPGGTVLDPFMGIGTTGLAALSLGRRFIGVELDSRYCEIARRKLEEVNNG
jgi:DNA modification methylase